MKLFRAIFFLAIGCFSGLQAGDDKPVMQANASVREPEISQELTADYSYVGGAKTHLGNIPLGHVTEQQSDIKYVMSRELEQNILLRFGAEWQQLSFGLPQNALLPNTLQDIHAIVGADFDLSDRWLLRVDWQPGLYSDLKDISFEDFNAPLTAGFSYLVNKNLQWVFGFDLNLRRHYPFLPGAGVRWQFADQWVLDFILPNPRLEYKPTDTLTAYIGGQFIVDTYKVSENFGVNHGRPNLNDATLDYSEYRAGAGVNWEFMPHLSAEVEGGYMIERKFDFYNANTQIGSGGAPYGQVALRANF